MFNQLDGAFPMVSEFHPNAFTAETRAGMSPYGSFSAPPHSLIWSPSRVTGPGPFIVHSHGRMHGLKLAE